MPSKRLSTGGFDTPAIRPVASPIDTFSRPAAGGGLSQLAAALGSVAPELRQLGNEVNARDAELESQKGEQYATELANSQEVWAGAIRDGKIAPAQSPWFRMAAKKKLGQVAADRFNIPLQENIAKLGEAPTPEAFESAVTSARKDFLKSVAGKSADDMSFMQGFDAVSEQQIASARRTFAAEHAKQFELNASEAYFNASHAMGRKAIDAGESADDIAARINAESDAWKGVNPAAVRSGSLSSTRLSKLNSDVVFSLLRSTHNIKLATDLAGKIKDGDGVLLDSAEFQSRLEAESDHVTADAKQKENDAFIEQQRQQAQLTDAARETLYERWKKGGVVDTSDVEVQLKGAGIRDPHATAVQLLDKMPEMDPTFYVGLRSRVARGAFPKIAELDAAARSNRISAGQYSALVSDIEEAQRAERALASQGMATTDGIWSHPAMRSLEDSIRAAAKTKAKVDPITGSIISYTGFTDNDVQQAVNEGKMYMAAWLSQNWSKFGSAQAAMQQATVAWRGYAAQHGVITADEASLGAKVLPADPSASEAVQRNSGSSAKPPKPGESRAKPATDFTRAEVRQMRTDLSRFGSMTAEQKKAWVSDPRHRSILKQLGDPSPEQLGAALAAAEATAK